MAKVPPLYEKKDCTQLSTQLDLNQCACGNRDAADKTLNDTYARVVAIMPNQNAKIKLRNAQRVWIKKRDQVCLSKVGSRKDSGTIWELDMCSCLEKITADRIIELNKMYPPSLEQLD